MNQAPTSFDVIVLGAGPAGEVAAGELSDLGFSVALIERELAGGDCSYWACMPSKAILRPGTALHAAAHVQGASQAITGTLDVQAVLDRRDEFTHHWDDSSQVEWILGKGIHFVRGDARISGVREVIVQDSDGEHTLTAFVAVVLATGSYPVVPDISGLENIQVWGTREATSARSVPERLGVFGGGVAGCELAQAFARLGSQVTLIARGTILGAMPDQVRQLVQAGLSESGVQVHEHTVIQQVSATAQGTVLELTGAQSLSVDQLLVSTGRKPSLRGIGLDSVGLESLDTGTATILVDDTSLVNTNDQSQWLYAVGDASGRTLLTHLGKYEGYRVAHAIKRRHDGENLNPAEPFADFTATTSHTAVPKVIFTDPEVAVVGPSLTEVQENGVSPVVVEQKLQTAGSSLHADDYQGWVQAIFDPETRCLLGVTLVGPDVSELLHAASIAIVGQVPVQRLIHAVPAYPSMSEWWLTVLDEARQQLL